MSSSRSTKRVSHAKQEPDTPYDQLSYAYYANKLLPKSGKIWGREHRVAVKDAAAAMEGTPREIFRLMEVKGAKIDEPGLWRALKYGWRKGITRAAQDHKKLLIYKDFLKSEVVSHESFHIADYLLSGGISSQSSLSSSSAVKNEFEAKKSLYKKLSHHRNPRKRLAHSMNDYAMTNAREFSAEAMRGSWGIHDPFYDPPDKKGEALRDFALERAPETIKFYDAHIQALRHELKKDQNHVDIRAVRKRAQSILARSERTTTPQQGESSTPSGPQINDLDTKERASPVPPLAPLPPERKGKRDQHSHHSSSSRRKSHRQEVQEARAGKARESH